MFQNQLIIDRIRGKVAPGGGAVVPVDALPTQGFLRLETSLQSTSASFTFNVLQNVGTPNDTEVRLKQTDMFTITHVGLYLMKAGSSTTATQAQIAQAVLYSNPNPLVFTGLGEAAALNAVTVNGKLQFTVDRKQIIPAWDNLRHYRVATSQKGVGSSAVSNQPIQLDGWETNNYGMAPFDPQLTISGAGQNEITLNLPNSTNCGGTSSQNFAVLILRGILWQGASKMAQ